jgi:HEAT repeat protein
MAMGQGDPAEQNLAEAARLLHTALYNCDGETVEGAFVDRWESYAQRARNALRRLADSHGFSAELETLIAEAVRAPEAPTEAAATLLRELHPHSRPLLARLLRDRTPRVRAVAVRVGPPMLEPAVLARTLKDASFEVRLAAVQTITEHRRVVPDAELLLVRALDDPDARVREAAGPAIGFYNNPEAAAALIRYLDQTSDPKSRAVIIESIARRVRREGVHVSRSVLRERVGEPIRALLLRELANPDPELRILIARALERLYDAEVAEAMFHRLTVEPELEVRRTLTLFEGYPLVEERALPFLAELLSSDPDGLIRARVAFLFEWFGPKTAPLLIEALSDVESNVRRAAAISLEKVGSVSALPGLVRELAAPANGYFHGTLRLAIQSILIRAEKRPDLPPPPNLQQRIRELIRALVADKLGQWPTRMARDEYQALPLWGSYGYLWCLTAEGAIIQLDLDAVAHVMDVETNPLVRFAAMMHGATKYPELWGLVPAAPPKTRPCLSCNSQGYMDEASCFSCSGLGWRHDPNWKGF